MDIFNKYPDYFANLENLPWVLYPSPRHFGNVQEPVCPAQVNKCTEIRYILYRAFQDIANIDPLKQGFLQLCLLSKQTLLPVPNNPSPAGVEFCNHKFDFLVFVLS